MPGTKRNIWNPLVALCALAAVLVIPAQQAATKDSPKAELSLKDLNGKRVRLSDYRGKIVALNFWATWCGPCNEEMPMLVESEKEYSPRGVVFLGASLDDEKTRKNVPEFLRKYQVTYPIWMGATGEDLDRLKMGPAVPATAFLDPDGHIVARIEGQMREAEIPERLDWLLRGQTGPAPQAVVVHLGNH